MSHEEESSHVRIVFPEGNRTAMTIAGIPYLRGIWRPASEGSVAIEFLTLRDHIVPVTVARPSRTHTGFLAPPR
jgi:hypothetical protein